MILSIIKTLGLLFLCYGIYCFIMLIFEIRDNRRYRRCAYIDAQKVSDVEDAVYTIIMRHPDTEIYIVYHNNTDEGTKKVISTLCRRFDIVFALEEH